MDATRGKAEFRAIRESVGMTQQALSDALGVQVRSVKRWETERDDGFYDPPAAAWDVLDEAMERQRRAVEAAIETVERIEAEHGEPDAVTLSYWLSESDYQEFSTDAGFGVAGDWRMANANARAAAAALWALGYDVTFRNGAPNAALPA